MGKSILSAHEMDLLSKWHCDNLTYLGLFLEKYYRGIDFNEADEIMRVSDNVAKCIYLPESKTVYKLFIADDVEFFDKNTWMLYEITNNFRKKEYKNFIVYLDSEMILEGYPKINFFEKYIDAVVDILKIDNFKKVEICILSKEIILKLLGTNEVTGFFDPFKGKIYSDLWNINLTHEIIHALVNEWKIWPNLFCQEGMAEAFGYPVSFPRNRIEKVKSFKDIYFSWADLDKEKYGIGGIFFRYLFEVYGSENVKLICQLSHNLGERETEQIIKNITQNEQMIKDFVRWFSKKDWDIENWYFPDWSC